MDLFNSKKASLDFKRFKGCMTNGSYFKKQNRFFT